MSTGIPVIFSTDKFSEMIDKINQGFQQLSILNGGPRGKNGRQGIPGLPGMQGIRGFKGETGRAGNKLVFIGSIPTDDDIIIDGDTLTTIPDQNKLVELINQGIYQVGDTFLVDGPLDGTEPTEGTTLYTFCKIQETEIEDDPYEYSYFTLNRISDSDGIWINHSSTYTGTVPNIPITINIPNSSNMQNINPPLGVPFDVTKNFLFNTYISSYNNTETDINSFFTQNSSVANPILLWNKRHFKLSIDQKSPYIGPKSQFEAYFNIIRPYSFHLDQSNLLLNIYGGYQKNSTNRQSNFSLYNRCAPILYLQLDETGGDSSYGDVGGTNGFTNFGIFIKRLPLNNQNKSILIIASDNSNTNDIYLRTKNVWSDGNFISDISSDPAQEKQDRFVRYYTPLLTGDIENNNICSTYYGNSKYNENNIFEFETGFDIRFNKTTSRQNGSINTKITSRDNLGNILQKILVSRIDENGNFKYCIDTRPDFPIFPAQPNYGSSNIETNTLFTIEEKRNDKQILNLIGSDNSFEFTNGNTGSRLLKIFGPNNQNFGIKFLRNELDSLSIETKNNGNNEIVSNLSTFSLLSLDNLNFGLRSGSTTNNIAGIRRSDNLFWISRQIINRPIGSSNNILLYLQGNNPILQIKDGSEANNKVLCSDEFGQTEWKYTYSTKPNLIWDFTFPSTLSNQDPVIQNNYNGTNYNYFGIPTGIVNFSANPSKVTWNIDKNSTFIYAVGSISNIFKQDEFSYSISSIIQVRINLPILTTLDSDLGTEIEFLLDISDTSLDVFRAESGSGATLQKTFFKIGTTATDDLLKLSPLEYTYIANGYKINFKVKWMRNHQWVVVHRSIEGRENCGVYPILFGEHNKQSEFLIDGTL